MTARIACAILLLTGCGGDGGGAAPIFPADYASHYVRVYPCRASVEHFLHSVAIWADPASATAYQNGPFPLRDGAVIVKEEFADEGCTQRVGWTAMRRQAGDGSDAGGFAAWTFQELDEGRRVVERHPHRDCVSCHRSCDASLGRDGTCVEP
jgi:hypothetical protein